MAKLYETAELEAELFEEAIEIEDFSYEEMTEDSEGLPALELYLDLEDGSTLEFELGGVFVHGDKEYAVLHPKTDEGGIIHLMELTQGDDDEIQLLPVAEEEWESVSASFYKYLSDAPYEYIEEFEDDYSEIELEDDTEVTENNFEGE